MVGMKVQVAKRKGSQKKSELAFMNLVAKISTQSTGAIRLISKIQDTTPKGVPLQFLSLIKLNATVVKSVIVMLILHCM